MLVKQTTLDHYYSAAKERKTEIMPVYNEVLELTDAFAKIEDSGKQKLGSRRDVDSEVTDSIDALKSFIMTSVFPRQGNWADLYIDEERLIEEEGQGIKAKITEINKTKGKDLDRVFKYIQNSNYYKEIARAVDSFIKVGTGCYCIRETGSTSRPFLYSYVGLDNLFIMEDSHSNPNIIFKLHSEVNGVYIKDLFGQDSVLPPEISEEDLEANVDVLECVIPNYDEETTMTTYNYMVVTEDFASVIKEQELKYNPFVVFRWDTKSGTPWGTSIVVDSLGLLKELESYKEIYRVQAKRIANPPASFLGNQELFYSVSTNEGAVNYLGDSFKEGNQGSFQYMDTGSNLMPLDKIIADDRMAFRRKLMVDNLVMNAEQGKNTTATYVTLMAEMFRKRFGATYESINSELLRPTFMAPFTIMLDARMLQLEPDIIPYVNLTYVNDLSKSTNLAEVNNLMSFTQVIGGLNQAQQAGVPLDIAKAMGWIADRMNIEKELIPTEDDLRAIQEMRIQQQQQAQAQQQGGMVDEQAQ